MSNISDLLEILTNILEDVKKIERRIEKMEKDIEKLETIEKSMETVVDFMGKIDIKKSKIKVKKYALDDSERLIMPSIRNHYGLPDFKKQFEEMKKAMKERKSIPVIKDTEEIEIEEE